MFDNFKADMDRYVAYSGRSRLMELLLSQGLWATMHYRFARWIHTRVRIPIVRQMLKLISLVWRRSIQMTTGIDLPEGADIGRGLYIGHFGGIIVGDGVKIGETCNISQGMTIGYAGRGEKWGCPTIGDRVYIAPGAVVAGRITVGNDAVIGANAVVTKDVPESAVVGGVPAKILSMEGSGEFIFGKLKPANKDAESILSSELDSPDADRGTIPGDK